MLASGAFDRLDPTVGGYGLLFDEKDHPAVEDIPRSPF